MSTSSVEIAEEALENKIENLKIDDNNGEAKSADGERKKRKFIPHSELARIWEEEQKSKKLVESGLKGKVKWYSVLGRYGFISRNDGGSDVFVHQSAIAKSLTNKLYLRTLNNEEDVEFDVVEGKKGLEASNVTGPNGDNVKGSKYRRILLYRFRSRKNEHSKSPLPKEDEKASGDASTDVIDKEATKKRRIRKNRKRSERKNAKVADSGDVEPTETAKDEKSPSDVTEVEEAQAATRRNIDEESNSDSEVHLQTNIDERCGSALSGDVALGAQPIEGQI